MTGYIFTGNLILRDNRNREEGSRCEGGCFFRFRGGCFGGENGGFSLYCGMGDGMNEIRENIFCPLLTRSVGSREQSAHG